MAFKTAFSPLAFSKARIKTSSSCSFGTTHTPSTSPVIISPGLIRTPFISEFIHCLLFSAK